MYHPTDSFIFIFEQFPNVEDEGRRTYSAMVAGMDMAVGSVVDALRQHGLYENSIILWSSDVSTRATVLLPVYKTFIIYCRTAPSPLPRAAGATTPCEDKRTLFGREAPELLPFFTLHCLILQERFMTGMAA